MKAVLELFAITALVCHIAGKSGSSGVFNSFVSSNTNKSVVHSYEAYSYSGGSGSSGMYESGDSDVTDYEAYGAHGGESGKSESNNDDEDLYDIEGTDLYVDDKYIEEENERVKNSLNESSWFYCDYQTLAITRDKLCDGIRDCFDCTDEMNCSSPKVQFFFCFGDSLMGENLSEYSYENPFCIPRVQFCDGKKDCLSGMDEKQIGYGFKCPLKERPNTCLVPDYFLCDGIADCQNNADLCPEITKPISGVTPSNKSEPAFPDTFNCLNHKKNVTIFQTQVCDGFIDCPDLSDECLCQPIAGNAMEELCNNVCWKQLWTNEPELESCRECKVGQVRICDSLQCKCSETDQLCIGDVDSMSELQKETCVSKSKNITFIDCLNIDGSFTLKRAQMCDGRPECWFGEDECIYECLLETNISSGHFCYLLKPGFGFTCNGKDVNSTNVWDDPFDFIVPCNGNIDCDNKMDEMFCPTRLPCHGNDVTAVSALSAQTYDIIQQCDGQVTCENKRDEDPVICNKQKTIPNENFNILKQSCMYWSTGDVMNDVIEEKQPAIYFSVLQIILLIFSAVGIIGNTAAVVISLKTALHKRFAQFKLDKSYRNFVALARESVFYPSVGGAKGLFCVYVAVVIFRLKINAVCNDKFLLETLHWCGYVGPAVFVVASVPIVALVVQSTLEVLVAFKPSAKNEPERCTVELETDTQTQNDPLQGIHIVPKSNESKIHRLLYLLTILLLYVIIWLPLVAVAIWAEHYYNGHAWVTLSLGNISKSSPNLILSKNEMIDISSRVATVNGRNETVNHTFTWGRLQEFMDEFSHIFEFEFYGVVSYYERTSVCLPSFFNEPVNFQPFIGSVKNFWFLLFLLVNLGYLIIAFKIERLKNVEHCSVVMHAFFIGEFVTWITIAIISFRTSQWLLMNFNFYYQDIVFTLLTVTSVFSSIVIIGVHYHHTSKVNV